MVFFWMESKKLIQKSQPVPHDNHWAWKLNHNAIEATYKIETTRQGKQSSEFCVFDNPKCGTTEFAHRVAILLHTEKSNRNKIVFSIIRLI